MFVIGFFAILTFILNHKEAFDIYSEDKILNDRYFYCELTITGGSEHENKRYLLQYNDEDYASLSFHDSSEGSHIRQERKVDQKIVADCKELYKKYGVLFWSDLQKGEPKSEDTPQKILKFSSSRASVSFTDDLVFHDNGEMIFQDIEVLLQQYLNQSSEGDVTHGSV